MSADVPPSLQSPPDDTLAGESARERAERRLRTLRRITERGADAAEAMAIRAQEAQFIDDAEKASAAYERFARAVRRAIALELRVESQLEAREKHRRETADADRVADLKRRIKVRKGRITAALFDNVMAADDAGRLGHVFCGDMLQDLHDHLDRIEDDDEDFAGKDLAEGDDDGGVEGEGGEGGDLDGVAQGGGGADGPVVGFRERLDGGRAQRLAAAARRRRLGVDGRDLMPRLGEGRQGGDGEVRRTQKGDPHAVALPRKGPAA
jgi:hypothetical protein